MSESEGRQDEGPTQVRVVLKNEEHRTQPAGERREEEKPPEKNWERTH